MASKYSFDDRFYSIEQLEEMLRYKDKEEQNEIIQIINQNSLAWILSSGSGDMPRLSEKMYAVAESHEKALSDVHSKESEKRQIRSRKKYSRKVEKFKFYAREVRNMDSCLHELLRSSLGDDEWRKYTTRIKSGHFLVDYWHIKPEQCKVIAKNVKRAMKGKDMIEFKTNSKTR